MTTRRLIAVLAVLAVLGGAVAAVLSLREPARPPPNVVFVLWDTVRADHLGLYGYDRPTTPHLERFGTQSVVFENAVSPGMWTVPSHGSMFTGLPPTSHNASFDWRWLDGHHHTVAEHFRDHGYATFAFSANPNLSKKGANLLQGFDVVQTSWNKNWWPLVRKVTAKKLIPTDKSTEISPAYEGEKNGNAYYNAAFATEKAFTQWLDTRTEPEQPFFAYLNYMEAHKPRIPAQRFREKVMPATLRSVALETDLTFAKQVGYGIGAVEYTDEEIEAARAVYDAALRELDHFFGRLLAQLKRRGLGRDTILVLTSDHGETLGEHHRFGHRHGVYQTLLHVPLVIRYPGVLEPAKVSTPVSTMDLYATLVELAGLPMPDGTLSTSLVAGAQREAVFAEVLSVDTAGLNLAAKLYPEVDLSNAGRTYRSIRRGVHKLIVDDQGTTSLYDLSTDPHESHALEDAALTASLQQSMETWWETIPKADPSKRTAEDRPMLRKDEKKMLEALGYMIDDGE